MANIELIQKPPDFYILSIQKTQSMLTYFIYMVTINIACMFLGSFLTQNNKLALPVLFRQLDKKPFNCRPCLTFHLLWISYMIAALILHSWTFFVVGLVFSFAIFTFLYIDDQNKISK